MAGREVGLKLSALKIRNLEVGRRVAELVKEKGVAMLYYALVFLVIALVAGLLGFGVVAFAAAEIARICFFIFIVLFLVSLIGHLFRRTSIP
jgi:uncharacterized membrane protein YtjA (UPF0391 family)